MRIELAEKIVFSFATLAIVATAGVVTFFSFVMTKNSFITEQVVDATIKVDDWLEEARTVSSGGALRPKGVIEPGVPIVGPSSPGGQPGGEARPPAKPAEPGQPDNYFDPNAQIPANEQVAGIPWLRKQEGVAYMRPEPVPQVLYEKYQAFDDAWQAAQEGAGQWVNGRYKIDYVNPNSYLATKAGIKEGDEILSVNGHPIGQSFSAGKALYDQLKTEKRFAVKVRRNGQETVLSFFVNN